MSFATSAPKLYWYMVAWTILSSILVQKPCTPRMSSARKKSNCMSLNSYPGCCGLVRKTHEVYREKRQKVKRAQERTSRPSHLPSTTAELFLKTKSCTQYWSWYSYWYCYCHMIWLRSSLRDFPRFQYCTTYKTKHNLLKQYKKFMYKCSSRKYTRESRFHVFDSGKKLTWPQPTA